MHLRTTLAAAALAGTFLFIGFRIIYAESDLVATRDVAFEAEVQGVLRGHTPLYFYSVLDKDHDWWFHPVPIYVSAGLNMVSIRAARAPAVIAGGLNIALVFFIAQALAGPIAACAAGFVLLFSVAHGALIVDMESLFPATFVLVWLAAFLIFLKRDSTRALVCAALALGLCVYSDQHGPLTAAFLWILTLALAWRRNRVRLALATAVFVLMWMPAAGWFYFHPETYPDTFGRWFVFKAHLRNPLDGVRAFFNLNTLSERASLYWGFWDPSWLVVEMFPAAPLCLVAIVRARHISQSAMQVLIGTALIAPLPGATFGLPHYMISASPVLPTLAILAGLGFDQLVKLLTRRKPLQDDVAMASTNGWDSEDVAPRG